MAFKDRLKLVVESFSTIREMARKAGLSESAIRKWLKGDSEPSLGNLVTLARIGQVRVEWLATGQGPMRKADKASLEAPTLAEKLARLEKGAMADAHDSGPDLSEPEIKSAISTLASRYSLEEWVLARIIGDLSSVGVGEDFALIPRYDVSVSAGPGSITEGEKVLDRIAFRLDWLKSELRLPLPGLLVVRARGDSMSPTIGEGDILLLDSHQERLADGGIFVILRGEELIVKRVQSTATGFLLVSDNPRYQPEPVVLSGDDSPKVIGRVVWVGHKLL